MFFVSFELVDHASSDLFNRSISSNPFPNLGVNNEIRMIFDWDKELFIPYLSTLITLSFTSSKDVTYSIASLSSLDLSVNNPDCNKNEVNR